MIRLFFYHYYLIFNIIFEKVLIIRIFAPDLAMLPNTLF